MVFTGGDELEDNDRTLDDYLGSQCPESLKVGSAILFLFIRFSTFVGD